LDLFQNQEHHNHHKQEQLLKSLLTIKWW
jgi:hypothetical protein